MYPANGAELTMRSCEAPDPQRENKGANAVWDFNALNCDDNWTFSFDGIEQSTQADQFLGANQFVNIQIQDIEIDAYYELTDEYWAHHGLNYDGYIFAAVDNSAEHLLKFPASYQDTWSNDYYYLNPEFGDFVLGDVTYTVDGYGKLILPNATYENVIRVHSLRSEENMFTYETYSYYSQDYKYQLFHMLVYDESQYQLNPMAVSVDDSVIKENPIQIFPNPIAKAHTLTVSLDSDGLADLELYSTVGKKVISKKSIQFSGGTYTLYLPTSLNQGLYTLHVLKDGVLQTSKLFVQN